MHVWSIDWWAQLYIICSGMGASHTQTNVQHWCDPTITPQCRCKQVVMDLEPGSKLGFSVSKHHVLHSSLIDLSVVKWIRDRKCSSQSLSNHWMFMNSIQFSIYYSWSGYVVIFFDATLSLTERLTPFRFVRPLLEQAKVVVVLPSLLWSPERLRTERVCFASVR